MGTALIPLLTCTVPTRSPTGQGHLQGTPAPGARRSREPVGSQPGDSPPSSATLGIVAGQQEATGAEVLLWAPAHHSLGASALTVSLTDEGRHRWSHLPRGGAPSTCPGLITLLLPQGSLLCEGLCSQRLC